MRDANKFSIWKWIINGFYKALSWKRRRRREEEMGKILSALLHGDWRQKKKKKLNVIGHRWLRASSSLDMWYVVDSTETLRLMLSLNIFTISSFLISSLWVVRASFLRVFCLKSSAMPNIPSEPRYMARKNLMLTFLCWKIYILFAFSILVFLFTVVVVRFGCSSDAWDLPRSRRSFSSVGCFCVAFYKSK